MRYTCEFQLGATSFSGVGKRLERFEFQGSVVGGSPAQVRAP